MSSLLVFGRARRPARRSTPTIARGGRAGQVSSSAGEDQGQPALDDDAADEAEPVRAVGGEDRATFRFQESGQRQPAAGSNDASDVAGHSPERRSEDVGGYEIEGQSPPDLLRPETVGDEVTDTGGDAVLLRVRHGHRYR